MCDAQYLLPGGKIRQGKHLAEQDNKIVTAIAGKLASGNYNLYTALSKRSLLLTI